MTDCFGIAARNRNKLDFLMKSDIKLRSEAVVIMTLTDFDVAEQVPIVFEDE